MLQCSFITVHTPPQSVTNTITLYIIVSLLCYLTLLYKSFPSFQNVVCFNVGLAIQLTLFTKFRTLFVDTNIFLQFV